MPWIQVKHWLWNYPVASWGCVFVRTRNNVSCILKFLRAERSSLATTGAAGCSQRVLSTDGTLWELQRSQQLHKPRVKTAHRFLPTKQTLPLSRHSLWPSHFLLDLLMQDHRAEMYRSQTSLPSPLVWAAPSPFVRDIWTPCPRERGTCPEGLNFSEIFMGLELFKAWPLANLSVNAS